MEDYVLGSNESFVRVNRKKRGKKDLRFVDGFRVVTHEAPSLWEGRNVVG